MLSPSLGRAGVCVGVGCQSCVPAPPSSSNPQMALSNLSVPRASSRTQTSHLCPVPAPTSDAERGWAMPATAEAHALVTATCAWDWPHECQGQPAPLRLPYLRSLGGASWPLNPAAPVLGSHSCSCCRGGQPWTQNHPRLPAPPQNVLPSSIYHPPPPLPPPKTSLPRSLCLQDSEFQAQGRFM